MSGSSRREVLRRQQEAQARAKRFNRMVLTGAIIAGVVILAVFGVILANQWGQNSANAGTPPHATADRDAIRVNPGKAAAGAPLVQLFVDYQCPICKEFEEKSGGVIAELAQAGKINLQYRTETFLDAKLGNDSSVRAAQAAACADTVGAYSNVHEAIFAAQPATEGDGYTTEQLRVTIPAAAGITGANLTSYQQCVDSSTMASFVRGVDEAAAKQNVRSSPVLWVNGQDIPFQTFFNASPDQLRVILEG